MMFVVNLSWSPGTDFSEGVVPATPEEVLALLAVAEAAKAHMEAHPCEDGYPTEAGCLLEDALRAALDRLDA